MTTRREVVLGGLSSLAALAAGTSGSLATGLSGSLALGSQTESDPRPAAGSPSPATAAPGRQRITIDAMVPDGPPSDPAAAITAGLTCVIADMRMYPRTFEGAVRALVEWETAFRADPRLLAARRAEDIERAAREGKLAIVLACQDGSILGASTFSVNDANLQNLAFFHDLGLRVLQLTHNEQNGLGGSFREKRDSGLSRLGEAVVGEMNRLGMLVDLSHCGPETTLQAIALSRRPCIISHAGCKALCPTGRNKGDAEIRALAERGGVMGVFNMSLWLTERPTTSIADVLDHIDHVVQVAGIDHAAFGSDGPVLSGPTSEEQLEGMRGYARRNLGLPGSERMPDHVTTAQLNHPARLARLADGLAKRGYGEADVDKIVGGNVLRLIREVCG